MYESKELKEAKGTAINLANALVVWRDTIVALEAKKKKPKKP